MRLHYGPIPESPDFQPETTGWTSLREPSVSLFVWLASGVGLVAGVLAIVVWVSTAEGLVVVSGSDDSRPASAVWTLGSLLAGVLLLIVVHELIHAAVVPGGWFSRQTILGVWPSKGLFYAAYDGPQSRNRFLVGMLMPFLVLTVGLWLVQLVFATSWSGPLAAWSILNAMFAGGDLLGSAMIAWQVPAQAQVRNQGWKTWWLAPAVLERNAAESVSSPAESKGEAMRDPA